MAMVHCRGCGQQIHETAPTCPHCGAPQGLAGSGSSDAAVPDGVKGWSWGAFLLNWIWAIFNGTWIGLLALVPFIGFVMAIVLGIKGREWAWKNKKWDSVEHFNRVQRLWSIWALCLLAIPLALGILAAVAIPAYENYKTRAEEARARLEEPRSTAAPAAPALNLPPQAPVADAPAAPPPQAVADNPPAALPAADLLAQASGCETSGACVTAMLAGAMPRRADVVQAALGRLGLLDKPEQGDRKAARELNKQALALFNGSDYGGAVALFEQASRTDPRDAEIKSNLGLALVKRGKGTEATMALLSALELDPRRSSAWAPMAEALELQQLDAQALQSLMLAYEFSGNKQKTVDYFRARSEAPGLTDKQHALYAKALATAEAGY